MHAFIWTVLFLLSAVSVGLLSGCSTLHTSAPVLADQVGGLRQAVYHGELKAEDGTPIRFTVFQPALPAGATAPLILHTHPFGLWRFAGPRRPLTQVLTSGDVVRRAWREGYWVISFDQRGHGASGDVMHIADPQREGRDVSRVIDWAQANLALASDDGDPRIGMIGESYGAGIQLIASALDQRIDALVPIAGWYNLERVLAPNDVPKSGWLTILVLAGIRTMADITVSYDGLRQRGVRKVGPYMVPKTMCSTVSANLATAFGIQGASYSINAACATSAHCIGAAADLIRAGRQDIMFAGGGEELHWTLSLQFDAMGALSTHHNEHPATASRPYDAGRDGFVIAGGAGMLVLEDYDHAKARGARIHAVLAGYGISSDGADMVAPSGEGAARCMHMALEGLDAPLDYLNTHGTSTPLGDLVELGAIRAAFGDAVPPLSSTKALSGHSLGAASVHEAIYCLLMMRDGFIAGSANIETLDPQAEGFPIVRESRDAVLDTVMSNSFGFGGTNASLVFRRDRG